MDTRLSCLIWGIIGVVFGLLALLFPELLLVTFYGMFLLLAGLTMAIFLFLAITSRSEDSMFWFGLSAVLLVVIVLSFLVQLVVQIIFLLIIAGIAFYNGFTDITLALTHPKTKYFLIPGMFIAGAILLAGLLWYFPALYRQPYHRYTWQFRICIWSGFHPDGTLPERNSKTRSPRRKMDFKR